MQDVVRRAVRDYLERASNSTGPWMTACTGMPMSCHACE
jgi:hypothetical protein